MATLSEVLGVTAEAHAVPPISGEEVEQDLMDLAWSGASVAMLLERLVEKTGKCCVLQGPNALVEHIHRAPRQGLGPGLVQQAIRESDAAARRWMLEAADPEVANLLCLELPSVNLVRLLSPVWVDGRVDAAVSVLGRPGELTAHDQSLVVGAARAIPLASLQLQSGVPIGLMARPRASMAAIVLRPPTASPELLLNIVRRHIDVVPANVCAGPKDVRAWLPYSTVDGWNARVARWHAELSDDVGTVTIGHALCRRGADAAAIEHTIVRAAEAAVVSERLFGPGQVTSYADAQLAKFLLSQHGASELHALYERAVGKLALEDFKQDSQLLVTLEAYCESFVTRRTAERLGVHRNTVLYRLKRIEEITSSDLEDGPTRLLLQLGLVAGRLLRMQGAGRAPALKYVVGRAAEVRRLEEPGGVLDLVR